MAYDEELAERVRAAMAAAGAVDQRRMFGGLAFFVGGHMTVCVSGQGGLMVRVPADDLPGLLERDDTAEMVMGSRTSRTWIRVSEDSLADDADLTAWVARALAVVAELPPK